jgi:hypothetical protein
VAGFQEVSEGAKVELLESHSVILMHEEPAVMDRRMYKGSLDDHGDDESVASEGYTLTIKSFKRNFQKN